VAQVGGGLVQVGGGLAVGWCRLVQVGGGLVQVGKWQVDEWQVGEWQFCKHTLATKHGCEHLPFGPVGEVLHATLTAGVMTLM
jgi:hypothetical protein